MSVSEKNEFTHSASGINEQTSDEIGQRARKRVFASLDAIIRGS